MDPPRSKPARRGGGGGRYFFFGEGGSTGWVASNLNPRGKSALPIA
jgi:hypothetical protein